MQILETIRDVATLILLILAISIVVFLIGTVIFNAIKDRIEESKNDQEEPKEIGKHSITKTIIVILILVVAFGGGIIFNDNYKAEEKAKENYSLAYDEAYNDIKTEKMSEIQNECYDSLLNLAKNQVEQQDYDDGYDKGYTDGYEAGYNKGDNDIGIEKYPDVFENGYNKGYEDGFDDGLNDNYYWSYDPETTMSHEDRAIEILAEKARQARSQNNEENTTKEPQSSPNVILPITENTTSVENVSFTETKSENKNTGSRITLYAIVLSSVIIILFAISVVLKKKNKNNQQDGD